jgi:hypothetical protein
MATERSVSAGSVAEYLLHYAEQYRVEYARFTAPAPEGAGYPPLTTSPFLGSGLLTCYVTPDGYVLADESGEPTYDWWIAGGPTMLVDTEPTSTPAEIRNLLEANQLVGKNIGIYRIVSPVKLTEDEWTGTLPVPDSVEERLSQGLMIRVNPIHHVLASDHFPPHLRGPRSNDRPPPPTSDSPFWEPHKIRRFGFAPATRSHRRWFSLLELSPHVSSAAWDVRALRTRVNVDVRRDFQHAVAVASQPGGYIEIAGEASRAPLDLIRDRLARLAQAIDEFAVLLADQSGAAEAVFHEFLARNPILLDVYGLVESKPRFVYPQGDSPLGKTYVEPDFIVAYAGQRYRLIELERPAKDLATRSGEPRSGVTQAAFQVGEWKDFINNHYDQLRSRYPGISSKPYTQVIISRSTTMRPADCDLARYQALLREQLAVDEVITFDNLLERARRAFVQIAGINLPASDGEAGLAEAGA